MDDEDGCWFDDEEDEEIFLKIVGDIMYCADFVEGNCDDCGNCWMFE